MRMRDGDYGSGELRPLTMPDNTLDPSLWRPMDRDKPGMSEAEQRKTYPLYSGLLKYFPDALAEVAHLSKVGNDQHNPGQPLHWDRAKSQDQLDALTRHLKDHAIYPFDKDGERHLTKVAWRALAELQLVLEAERAEVAHYAHGAKEAMEKAAADQRTTLTPTSYETTFEPVK